MKANQITQWLLRALLLINVVLIGIVWNSVNERADRTDRRLEQIEEKVTNIQVQYGQITEIKATVAAHGKQLDRMENWLYSLILSPPK